MKGKPIAASGPRFLGELELVVLEHMWANPSADPKAVHDVVGPPRGITLNTIGSTLRRLHDKGLLAREKVSHAYVYSPRLSREEFHQQALSQVVSLVMDGEPEAMVSAFADLTERAGHEHLLRLERLVEERLKAQKDGA